jgi:NADH:ubiquinone oxidoreductase subunit 2 (subunit N)
MTYLIKIGNEGISRLNKAQVMLITHTPMYVESLRDFTSIVPFFFWLDDVYSERNDDTAARGGGRKT